MKKAYSSPKSREKAEAAWTVAMRLQQFGYAEISSEMTIPIEFATHIVQAWNREGRIRVITPHSGAGRMLFEVVPAHELRIVAAQGDAHDQMWTAMRKLGSFSPVDIAAHCAADVSIEDARAYCRMRQPLRKIHHTAARQSSVKPRIAARLATIGTSAASKNDQRNTDMR